ncbi:MAG: peptidylprolyl isomerase, partial [Actinomycetia bacterium]|nr:peptidylprolyl isomerase [Actinomycetes bacterium]
GLDERLPMKRLLVVLVALSVTAAACSSSDGVVASVNDEDIVRSQIEILAPERDQDSSADFTRFLSAVILWTAVSQAAATEFGIEPTEEEIDARLDELVAAQGEGATLEALLGEASTTEEGIRQLSEQLVIQDAIQEEFGTTVDSVSEDLVSNELANNYIDWTVVCAAHILVETEDEAAVVLVRLDAGEDFGEVARELSTDVGSGANGGDLGCRSPAGYVPEFAAATMTADIGVVTDPVESEFGYHIILVSQREEATPEVVRASMERDAIAGAVDSWFLSVITDAVVVVDEAIGVWVTDPTPQVVTIN